MNTKEQSKQIQSLRVKHKVIVNGQEVYDHKDDGMIVSVKSRHV